MVQQLKRPLIIGVLICIALGIIYFGVILYADIHDETAASIIREAVPLIDEYQEQHGRYPEALEEITNVTNANKRVLFVFPSPQIKYGVLSTGYYLEYYQFPFGPFHGYDSNSRQWYFQE